MNKALRGQALFFAARTLLTVLVVPGVAAAGGFECEIRSLHTDDELRLISTARASLPPDIEPFITHPCRNPDSAHAGIMTAHVRTHTGVIYWWEFTCQREFEDWHCEPPRFKQFINTQLLVGGKPRRVALSFDKHATLDRAQQLTTQALTIYADPASRLPWCSREDQQDSDWVVLRQRSRLPVANKPIHVNVTFNGDTGSVTLDDIQIDIRFPMNLGDAAHPTAQCWDEWSSVSG